MGDKSRLSISSRYWKTFIVSFEKELLEIPGCLEFLEILRFPEDPQVRQEDVEAIMALLLSNEKFSSQLTSFTLRRADPHPIDYLPKFTALTALDLGGNQLGIHASSLAQSFCFFNLSSLVLSDNALGDAGLEAISTEVHRLTKLTLLDLSQNEITDEGLTAFLRCSQFAVLERLDLSFNRIMNRGAICLASCMKEGIGRLTMLNLQSNAIEEFGVAALLKACLSRDITQLFLSQNISKIIGIPQHQTTFTTRAKALAFMRSNVLFFAAATGDVELVRELLMTGADANRVDETFGECALHAAARRGQDEVIHVLVKEGGARLRLANMALKTPLEVVPEEFVATKELLEEMLFMGADERPGFMTKSARKRYKPLQLDSTESAGASCSSPKEPEQ